MAVCKTQRGEAYVGQAKHFLPYRAYIVCNLLIELVPMVAVVALFLSGMHSQMRDEVLDMRRTNLRHALDTIDQTLENFGSMALYASLDDDLRPYQLRKNDYDAITALNHLKQHAASQSDMSIYLHIRSE